MFDVRRLLLKAVLHLVELTGRGRRIAVCKDRIRDYSHEPLTVRSVYGPIRLQGRDFGSNGARRVCDTSQRTAVAVQQT